jgi:hypothetical protein
MLLTWLAVGVAAFLGGAWWLLCVASEAPEDLDRERWLTDRYHSGD